jgi:hypothetical protein
MEGILPYNTQEGTITVNVATNKEAIELQNVEFVEPLEYSDTYAPYKYGVIFKEKVYCGDATSAAFHVRMRINKEDTPDLPLEKQRLFKFQILEDEKVVLETQGRN